MTCDDLAKKNVKLETKNLARYTKKSAERMTAKNFVKRLLRNAKREIRNHVRLTKRNAKEISMTTAKQLQRSAKPETRRPVIFTKRNAERSTLLPLTNTATP